MRFVCLTTPSIFGGDGVGGGGGEGRICFLQNLVVKGGEKDAVYICTKKKNLHIRRIENIFIVLFMEGCRAITLSTPSKKVTQHDFD